MLDGVRDSLQQPMCIVAAGGDAGYAEHRTLPVVVRLHFGHRDVELVTYAREKGFQNAALAFEGIVTWQTQLKIEISN